MKNVFDSPVHSLYSVMAFVAAALVTTLLLSAIQNRNTKKTNLVLIFIWVIFFCLQDGTWGLFASHSIRNDIGLTIASYIFHFSAITSSTLWCAYYLSRIKGKVKYQRLYLGASIFLTLIQYGMLIGNIFTDFMFYVDEHGMYCTTDYRSIMFNIQMAEYFVIGIVSIVYLMRTEMRENRKLLIADFAANLCPIIFGLLQMVYPDAPFDSIGFMGSCLIIHTFLSRDYEQQVIDLKKLQKELNIALEKTEAANAAKTSFLFNMSHDIRTPMNAISGFTNMAIKNIGDDEKVLGNLRKTQEASNLLLSLINDILDMSRIESGKTELNKAPFDIRDFDLRIGPVISELAQAKNIDLQISKGEIIDNNVIVDLGRVDRILLNLSGNAIKYTNEGGQVRINLRQLPSEIEGIGLYEYTIADNGIGMSEEFQQHMFEEFSRETNSTTSGIQGTGLGLTVTKAFVDLMNGTISCESKPGEGTKFTVVLPLEITDEVDTSNGDETGERDISEVLRGKTILLVEDNEMNREIAVDILEDIADLKVDTAEDGTVAVDKLKKLGPNYYDCIIMDIQMPFMNGYEASKAIREMYPDSGIPIIALSANAFDEDKRNSLAAGMNDHLSKPIDISQLKQVLIKNIL